MLESGKAAMLHFIYNSKVVCVLISHDIEQGEFVLQVPYYPPIETLDDFKNDPARCVKIVIDAIRSQEDGSFSKKSINLVQLNSWRMESVIADKYY